MTLNHAEEHTQTSASEGGSASIKVKLIRTVKERQKRNMQSRFHFNAAEEEEEEEEEEE